MTKFNRRIALAGALALTTALTLPSAAFAEYPERQITFVIPYNAGGGLDFVARILATGIEKQTGASVIVDPRPGAAGTIGAQSVLQAEPDGYTVMLAPAAPLVNVPLLRDTVPYDAEADFVPITKLVVSPIMVLNNKNVKAENLKELVELARANPGDISIGNSGTGSTQQLLSLIFSQGVGAELNMISYSGSGEIVPDLLAGRLDMMLDFPAAYAGYVPTGEVRMLATLGEVRNPLFPDIPTVAEEGFPEVPAWSGWFSMFADKDTPQEARDWLATEVQKFLKSDEAIKALAAGGYTPDPVDAAAVNKLMEGERTVLRALVEKYDLKAK